MTLQANLHKLFLLEQQVRGLRTRLDSAESRFNAQSGKLSQFKQQHAELMQQYKESQAHASSLEGESKQIEQKVAKAREQMNSVQSHKEYSALLVEVNTLKGEMGKKEEAALEAMTKSDQLKASVDEIEARVADQQKLVDVAQHEVTERRGEVGERLDEATNLRDAAAGEIPADALKTFQRLASIYDGEALASVIEENRKRHEYNCSGCYMQLPFERVNTVISRPNELTICPNCQRILYMDEENKTAMVAK